MTPEQRMQQFAVTVLRAQGLPATDVTVSILRKSAEWMKNIRFLIAMSQSAELTDQGEN